MEIKRDFNEKFIEQHRFMSRNNSCARPLINSLINLIYDLCHFVSWIVFKNQKISKIFDIY
jgi:hypothetical protein